MEQNEASPSESSSPSAHQQNGAQKEKKTLFSRGGLPSIKMPSMKMPDMKMPDVKIPDMFKSKSGDAKASKSSPIKEPEAAARAAAAPMPQVASVGSRVMVKGLNGAAHYNGKFGIVKEIMEKDGEERLCVVLDGDGRQLSVKRSNAEVHIHVQSLATSSGMEHSELADFEVHIKVMKSRPVPAGSNNPISITPSKNCHLSSQVT